MDALSDNSFAASIGKYERIYAECTLSAKPRAEIFCGWVLSGLAIGFIIATLQHLVELGRDGPWLLLWPLGVLVHNLRDAISRQNMVFEEALYRFLWLRGYRGPVRPRNRAVAVVRDLFCIVLSIGLMMSIAWGEVVILEKVWPAQITRLVTYTGGG